MSTRIWRYPDLRNGATLHHITDTHFGIAYAAAWQPGWMHRMGRDVEDLRVAQNSGHLHTGDMINAWFTDDGQGAQQVADQTADYVAWRDAIKATDGQPFAEAVGNHDMFGWRVGTAGWTGRSGTDWATSIGLQQVNNTYDMGQIRVITLGPEWWIAPDQPWSLTDTVLDWLDTELSADSRPTFLAGHVPLLEQYPNDVETGDGANPRLPDLIGSHTNVVGWLCGHRHNNVQTDLGFAKTITVGGREIFTVCGPAAGGDTRGTGGSSVHQWRSPVQSLWLTLLDDTTLDVRCRNHLTRSWVSMHDDPTLTHLTLTRTA